jgi:AhpD family alkylhydroperoxidase
LKRKGDLRWARVNLIDPITATGAAKPLLDEISGAFGAAPNMFRAVANSAVALKSM